MEALGKPPVMKIKGFESLVPSVAVVVKLFPPLANSPDPPVSGSCPDEIVPEISEKAGCVRFGCPADDMEFTHLLPTALILFTPPKVEVEGFGRSVSAIVFQLGA